MPKFDRLAALLEDLCHGEFIATKTPDKNVSLFFLIKSSLNYASKYLNNKKGTEEAPFV